MQSRIAARAAVLDALLLVADPQVSVVFAGLAWGEEEWRPPVDEVAWMLSWLPDLQARWLVPLLTAVQDPGYTPVHKWEVVHLCEAAAHLAAAFPDLGRPLGGLVAAVASHPDAEIRCAGLKSTPVWLRGLQGARETWDADGQACHDAVLGGRADPSTAEVALGALRAAGDPCASRR